MSAVNALAGLGFRCSDITRQALPSGAGLSGTFYCTAPRDLAANWPQSDFILTFSEQGVVLDVIPKDPSGPSSHQARPAHGQAKP